MDILDKLSAKDYYYLFFLSELYSFKAQMYWR